ncbi:hypothetical protein ACSBR2_026750 [Camellia fascicularis]
MKSYNPYRDIVHLNAFIDVFRPKNQELTIEILDCPDTYVVKWLGENVEVDPLIVHRGEL